MASKGKEEIKNGATGNYFTGGIKKKIQSEVQSRKGSINDLPKMNFMNF